MVKGCVLLFCLVLLNTGPPILLAENPLTAG